MKKLHPEFISTLKDFIAEKAPKDFDELSRRQLLVDITTELEWLANGHSSVGQFEVIYLLNKSRNQFNKFYYADFYIGKQLFQLAVDPVKDFFDEPFSAFKFASPVSTEEKES